MGLKVILNQATVSVPPKHPNGMKGAGIRHYKKNSATASKSKPSTRASQAEPST